MLRGPQGEKCPTDVIGSPVRVLQIVTGEIDDTTPQANSGKARAKALTSKQRVEAGSWQFQRARRNLKTKSSSSRSSDAFRISMSRVKSISNWMAGIECFFSDRVQDTSRENLSFADAAFETVAFSNSLHHMPHPAIALHEAVRVIKPGHLLYMTEPVPFGNCHEATNLVIDEPEIRTQSYHTLIRLNETEC